MELIMRFTILRQTDVWKLILTRLIFRRGREKIRLLFRKSWD